MKIEQQFTMEQIPVEIEKCIEQLSSRTAGLTTVLESLHPEKIYSSYSSVDSFRRELYELDVLSQNLMDVLRLYSAYAYQAMYQQPEFTESDIENFDFEQEEYCAPEGESGESDDEES